METTQINYKKKLASLCHICKDKEFYDQFIFLHLETNWVLSERNTELIFMQILFSPTAIPYLEGKYSPLSKQFLKTNVIFPVLHQG